MSHRMDKWKVYGWLKFSLFVRSIFLEIMPLWVLESLICFGIGGVKTNIYLYNCLEMYVYQLQWKFLYQTRMTLTQGGTCLKWVIDSDLIFLWMNLGYILLSIHLLIILVLSLDRYDGIQLTSILHWATQFWGWRVGYFRLLQCLWWYEHDFLHGLIITWDSFFFFFFFCHDHLRQILPVNSFPNFLQTNQLCFCFDTPVFDTIDC